MKKIAVFLCVATFFAATSFAQTYTALNTSHTISRKVTTTTNTATQIDLATIANNEVGELTVHVIGKVSDTSGYVTGTLKYQYQKTSAGTLTLSAAVIADTIRTGIGMGGSTFAASVVSNNIVIKVTGPSSKTVYWRSIATRYFIKP